MNNVKMIYACDLNGGIGNKNKLPWPNSSEDMKWFKTCTDNDVVLMGKRTWESLGSKPLSNRINIVATHQLIDGVETVSGHAYDILTSLKKKYPDKTIWIIGGAYLYVNFMPFCETIYRTVFKSIYEADTFLKVDFSDMFNLAKNDKEELSFEIWTKGL